MNNSALISFFLFSVLAFNLNGQTGKMNDTLKMKEIEVSRTRNQGKELLKSIQMDSMAIINHVDGTLADMLAHSAVYIRNYGASMVATPTFRGTAADHTKIYWNDMPLNSSFYGIQDLNLIPVFLLDDVNINYSGASLAHGIGGFGGSLNLSSNTKPDTSRVMFLSEAGSFGQYKNDLGVNYGSHHLWASTKVYYIKAENNFPYINTFTWGNPSETEKDASMYQYGILQSVRWQTNQNDQLKADIWYQNSFRNLPQTMISSDNHESQKDESLRAILNYGHYGDRYYAGLNGSYTREYLFYHNQLSDINSPSTNDRYELKALYNPVFKLPLQLKTGISDVEEIAWIKEYYGTKMRNRADIWADATYLISNRWEAGIISRLEWVDFKTPLLAYTGSMAFKALDAEKLVFHLNGGRNFNEPNLNDLYWYPGGNPNLQAERTWFGEFGISSRIRFRNDNEINIGFDLFSNLIDNYILWTPSGSSYWQAQNLKVVWARGVEASFLYRHHWQRSDLVFRFNYQYTPSTDQNRTSVYDQTLGEQLIYIPLHNIQAGIDFQTGFYEFTVEYTYSGSRYTTDGELPGYNLVNIYAGRDFNIRTARFHINVKCNNITNESYQIIAWRPMPGRWYAISLSLKI